MAAILTAHEPARPSASADRWGSALCDQRLLYDSEIATADGSGGDWM
jgi:hypothetical protein